jgi:hypothetical protein
METKTDRQPRAGEIVMICADLLVKSATSRGAHLMKIPGGPRVFSNLDDRFFSEWLYFCDDCYTKASTDAREVVGLIHGPMEWIGDREGVLVSSIASLRIHLSEFQAASRSSTC